MSSLGVLVPLRAHTCEAQCSFRPQAPLAMMFGTGQEQDRLRTGVPLSTKEIVCQKWV